MASLGRSKEVELLLPGLEEQELVRGLLAAALGQEKEARELLEARLAALPSCSEALLALASLQWEGDREASVGLYLRAAR